MGAKKVVEEGTYMFGREEKTGGQLTKDDLLALIPPAIVAVKGKEWKDGVSYFLIVCPSRNLIQSGIYRMMSDGWERKLRNYGVVAYRGLGNDGEFLMAVGNKDYLISTEKNYVTACEAGYLWNQY